jgi:glutamate racemase
MKIGIFDSGVGGLIVTRTIRKAMPAYDYVYLGDTKRVPYGNRSHAQVLKFTREGVQYLFNKENCVIIIIACNTASARALRQIQKEYIDKKVLGVLIPAAEEAAKFKSVGILGTVGTVKSGTFPKEIKKLNNKVKILQNPAPLLVPMIEKGEYDEKVLKNYLKPFKNIDALVLGCTHYPIFKKEIKKLILKSVKIISQDEIVPKKLKNYFLRHSEISKKLSHNHTAKILVTKITPHVKKLSQNWFGGKVKPELVNIV